jgi:hypothetical protein
MGHRGSTSAQASEYKLKGHADELIFSNLIGGKVKTDATTGKADVIGPDEKVYTVKGGQIKWQIFLYGYERFKTDKEFQNLNGIGKLILECLDSFPVQYRNYELDKNLCKEILKSHSLSHPKLGALKDIDKLKQIIPNENIYFNSKLKLKIATKKLRDQLAKDDNLKLFLNKSIFNSSEVDRIAIKKGSVFLVFEKEDVLKILSKNLLIENSVSGNRKTDLNIDGQKVIMKTTVNIIEIEIRNDSDKHYRQVRFNMNKVKALQLLEENCIQKSNIGKQIIFMKMIS